ncbi:hypothetical protein K7X08_015210 [Anisodus acutangulus]|uniref:Uncharacterized protein n=1 Tax=Anisodus acutangulus TaxID=402998 RepID=A0A9Q1QTE1_9SOLA|nr:hypothetical protein K7X08_015210 [Anisodus acutangulus]
MATLVPEVENWACINGCNNDLCNFDHSQIDCALLMSLLDDSKGLEYIDHDNERLTSVIRSLQTEIDEQHMINDHDSVQDSQGSNNGDDWQSREAGQGQISQDFPKSDDLDFNWMDIEMEIAPSSTSDDMNFWYLDTSYGQDHEAHDVYEYGYGAFPLEENSSALTTHG